MKNALKFSLASIVILTVLFAREAATPPPEKKGGTGPFLASCCIGPRVGLEMNEGKPIETMEWVRFLGGMVPYIGTLVQAYACWDIGGKTNGFNGCLASWCLGPRVGGQLHERKIRTNEYLQLILIGRIMISFEALGGKTMTEIEVAEGLRKG